jgi:tetratricopeptide (TPR) repeat protein
LPLDKNAITRDAQRYASRGQIDKAVAEWQKLLKETPNDGNIHNTIGDLYLRIRAQKEAIESYRKAAGIFQRDGFTLKALALYKKIININPNQIDVLISLAELNAERGLIGNANENYLAVAEYYTKEGSVPKALEIYERMVNLNPGNINLRLRLAELYIKEGLPEDGVNKYLEAASTYIDKGETHKAKELYQKVLGYRPKNLDALKGLCTINLSERRISLKEEAYKEAYEIIKKAVDLYPERNEVLLLYAKSAFSIDRLEEAKDIFLKLLNVEPENEEARESLARVYLKEGRKEASLEEFKKVLDSLIQKDELEGATTLLQEMIDIEPENPKLHQTLADLYKKLEKEEDVKKEYEFLASIYINQGDSEKASNVIKILIEMDPANNEYRRRLEEIKRVPTVAAFEEVPSTEGFVEEAPTFAVSEERPSEEMVIEEAIRIAPEGLEKKREEEVLTEADVYQRYGLVDKAIEIIKNFLDMCPESTKSRTMLKEIFKTQGMKDEFIVECLALADIYQREGRDEERLQILNEAIEKEPEDERILLRLGQKIYPEVAEREIPPREIEERVGPEISPEEEITPEVLEERISEADFYAQQGLVEEAKKLYEWILKLQPENEDIREKIKTLTGKEEREEEITFVKEEQEALIPEEAPKGLEEGLTFVKEEPETVLSEQALTEKEEEITSVKGEPEAVVLEEPHEEFIDFATELKEEIEAELPKSPLQDKGLQDIFHEFKKGIDREIGEKDYDTHYNLGIAYKEMGLIDEAIGEFQVATKGPHRYVQATSMLGLCFMEKELYQLAIKEFKKAIDAVGEGTEEYTGLKYDLGTAYEKAGMLDEAFNIYTDVYGIDAKFREVRSRIERLKRTVSATAIPEKKTQKPKKERISYL